MLSIRLYRSRECLYRSFKLWLSLYIFYFHGAKVGKKINLIKQNNHIGFEIDNNHQLVEGKTPCQYSMKYQSIIGKGHIELIEDNEEKKLGLQLIMKNVAHQDVTFSNQMISNVAVMKLIVDTLSCKEHQ